MCCMRTQMGEGRTACARQQPDRPAGGCGPERGGGALRWVAATLLLSVAFGACSAGSLPSPSPSPSNIPQPAPTAAPASAGAAAGPAWGRVEVDVPDLDPVGPSVGALRGEGFIAVAPTGRVQAPVVLQSATGTAWRSTGTLPAAADCPTCANYWPTGVASTGDSVVVVGRTRPGDDLVVWTKGTAASWRPLRPLSGAMRGWPIAVAADADNYVIALNGRQPGVLVGSADGVTWTPASLPLPPGTGGREARVAAVAQCGPGFTAVGSTGSDSETRGIFWTSPDGRSWSLSTPLPPGEAFDAVSCGTAATVVLGHSVRPAAEPQLLVWKSINSTAAWRPIDSVPQVRSGTGVIAPYRGGFVVAGLPAAGTGALIWRSADGEEWSPVPVDTVGSNGLSIETATGVAVDGDRAVVVGYAISAGSGNRHDPASEPVMESWTPTDGAG